jgi:hypothetical protein
LDSPGATDTPEAREIADAPFTVTAAVAPVTLGTPAAAAAFTVAEPVAPAVTGTLTVVAFAGIVIEAGTLATPGLLEVSVTANPPAGAGADRDKVRFCVVPASTDNVAGDNDRLPLIWTFRLADT